MRQNPFSLYDFLGYFIPGSFLIYLIDLITLLKQQNSIDFVVLLNKIPTLRTEGIVLILILSYATGHILSFLSSITVEKYSLWRYGYPSKYLLGFENSGFRKHFGTWKGIFWGGVMVIIILPTIILDYVLGNYFGFRDFYVKPLDKTLSKIISFKINTLINNLGITDKNGFKRGDGNNSDFFRIIQHYTYENSKNHQNKFSNYVALYGFLRTMTLIMNVLFWYLIVHFTWMKKLDGLFLILLLVVSLIAYSFFMAFMKFYRRYTLEGFMVLCVDPQIK